MCSSLTLVMEHMVSCMEWATSHSPPWLLLASSGALDYWAMGPLRQPKHPEHLEDWDEPEYILDTSAEKPEDWDNATNGEWYPPMIKNPLYRGEWKPRKIDNPNYKGIWPYPQIENPNYSPDFNIYSYENISIIGLDLWQVRAGTIFDNFLITDNEEFAEDFGDQTWGETKDPEEKMNIKQTEEEKERERAKEEKRFRERSNRKVEKQKEPEKDKSKGITVKKEEL